MSTISQYETHAGDGDQKNSKATNESKPILENAPANAHKLNDYHDQHSLANRAKAEKQREKEEKEAENEPAPRATLAAEKHGNKPSRGAVVDDELRAEDEQRIREMDGK